MNSSVYGKRFVLFCLLLESVLNRAKLLTRVGKIWICVFRMNKYMYLNSCDKCEINVCTMHDVYEIASKMRDQK